MDWAASSATGQLPTDSAFPIGGLQVGRDRIVNEGLDSATFEVGHQLIALRGTDDPSSGARTRSHRASRPV